MSAAERIEATAHRPALVHIPAGRFVMGSPASEPGRYEREPLYPVDLTRAFYMAATPITQGQYAEIIGNNPSWFGEGTEAASRPVETVNWFAATHFCNELSKAEGLTPVYDISPKRLVVNFEANGYRLPTESEWEYAARAGQQVRFTTGASEQHLAAEAWLLVNAGNTTHPVGQKSANAWGLHDMLGNVREWCHGWFGNLPALEGSARAQNPEGAPFGRGRTVRGGCYMNDVNQVRVAYRNGRNPEEADSTTGFRVVRLA